jgi:hypothetical protein
MMQGLESNTRKNYMLASKEMHTHIVEEELRLKEQQLEKQKM